MPPPDPRRQLPDLPPELWAEVLKSLPTAKALCTAARVSTTWNKELTTTRSEPLWRAIWDLSSRLPSRALPSWARVPGPWRSQVAASYNLISLHPPTIHVPPRYDPIGNVLPLDAVAMPQGPIDVDDVLQNATSALALANCVVLGFVRGLAVLIRPGVLPTCVARRTRPPRPVLIYDDAPLLGEILRLAPRPVGPEGAVVAVTATHCVVRVDVCLAARSPRRVLRWAVIDSFAHETGAVVQLSVSEDDAHAIVCFDNGRVRVVHIAQGGCRRLFTPGEAADHVVANRRWLVAASAFQPITLGVWDLVEGVSVHTFSQTSVGWESVTTVAAVCATASEDRFAIWNGRDAIRFLNVKTGEFVRTVPVTSVFPALPRSATEEAEHGAASAQLGDRRMVRSHDNFVYAVAASNRVFLVRGAQTASPFTLQLDGARHSLLALSTDDRVLVTGEGNAFGALGSKVSGRKCINTPPRLRFWDVESGLLRGEVVVPSAVTSLSVCGDTVAAVCGAVGQVMVLFGTPVR